MHKVKIAAAGLAALISIAVLPGSASAAQCGNDGSGFSAWLSEFKREAAGNGINPSVVEQALANVSYSRATIRADRGQKSFKLSLDQFMQKRGGQVIISRGKKLRAQNARLFQSIEQRYGVPAGR